MEDNQKSSFFQATLIWGLITGIASIVYTLVLYMVDLMQNKPLQYSGLIITLLGLYFGIKSIREQNYNGFISYGRSLGSGVLISLFSTIVSLIFMVILYTVIDPNLIDKTLQESVNQMAARGMTEDQIEQGIKMSHKFFIPFLVIGGLVFGTLMGFIISLILSIFMKKEENPFQNPSEQKSE